MLQLFALLALILAGALEVCGVGFWGLDLLVGLLFAAASGLAAASIMREGSLVWGLIISVTGALCLALHAAINLGLV